MTRAALADWMPGAESWSGERGAYRVRVRYGTPDGVKVAQGKGATKGAARAAMLANIERARAKYEGRQHTRGVDGAQTLARYAAGWHERNVAAHSWSKRTEDLYGSNLAVLGTLPLGSIPVAKVTTGDVKDALTKVAQDRGAGAARSLRTVIGGALSDAVERDVVPRNVSRDVDIKRATKGAKVHEQKRQTDSGRTLSTTELSKLLRDIRDPKTTTGGVARGTRATVNADMGELITVWVALALRVSEVLSLTWAGVDLDAATVEVNGTKTDGSKATLPLPAWAVETLRTRQTRMLTDGSLGHYVFPGRSGGKRGQAAVNRRLVAVLDAAGLTWAKGHTLRKTAVTLAYETDGPIVAQRLARHANVRTTQAYYVKATGEALKVSAAFNALDV